LNGDIPFPYALRQFILLARCRLKVKEKKNLPNPRTPAQHPGAAWMGQGLNRKKEDILGTRQG
jgi:hypothetical protein